jgi:hypothetical protein
MTFPAAPPRPATISERETTALNQFTANNLFDAQVVPNQTGQGYLLLDRIPTTTGAEQVLQSAVQGATPTATATPSGSTARKPAKKP